MANQSRERDQQAQQGQRSASSEVRPFKEPEMRRWPHPVDGAAPTDTRPAAPVGQTDASLHYIHCALSYQNQLLSEIKSTLEQLVLNLTPKAEEK